MNHVSRPRLIVYSILGVVAATILFDRFVAWHFDPRTSNAPDGVILYSTQWCGYCAQVRQCFNDSRVPFVERDVEASWRASIEWRALRVRGVPAVVIGRQLINGFQPAALTEKLSAQGFAIECWRDARD